MPIQVASFIIPKVGAEWFVLEDKYIKGGYQSRATLVERDAIPNENRKAGMLVFTREDGSLWQLQDDMFTWNAMSTEGPKGDQGEQGIQGIQGEVGKSSYQEWIDAGHTGTVEDFFLTLKGPAGDKGEQGIQGDAGKSSYQEWIDADNIGTVEDFLASLKGADGTNGIDGAIGDSLRVDQTGNVVELSAYNDAAKGFVFLAQDTNELYVKTNNDVGDFWTPPISFGIPIPGPQGIQGEQGIQGIQGEQGIQGIQGERGLQGDQGEPGQSTYQVWLSIGNTGTITDFLATTKGEKGDKGDKGDQGIQGERGLQGDRGVQGPSLYQTWLANGNTGTVDEFYATLEGPKGDQGIQGVKGDQGIQGVKGDKGDKGDQGIQGVKGDQGLPGLKGDKGDTGLSAYQSWLALGNIGTELDYYNSLKGAKGDQGIQGPAGTVTGGTVNGNIDVNGNIKFKNIFANVASFPSATTYEGMFAVAEDTNKAYYSSDDAWIELANSNDRVIPYDLSFFVPGSMPTANELVGAFVVTRTIAITAGMPGSFAKAKTAPAATTVYSVNVNGVAKGTVTFAPGALVGTFAMAANLTLATGDTVELVTPGTVDASIKDVMITIVGRAAAPQLSMSFT